MGNKPGSSPKASSPLSRKASSRSKMHFVASPDPSPSDNSSPDLDLAMTPRLDESDLYRIGLLGERGTGKSALFFQLTEVRLRQCRQTPPVIAFSDLAFVPIAQSMFAYFLLNISSKIIYSNENADVLLLVSLPRVALFCPPS